MLEVVDEVEGCKRGVSVLAHRAVVDSPSWCKVTGEMDGHAVSTAQASSVCTPHCGYSGLDLEKVGVEKFRVICTERT